ncbi:hypothetical protein [Methylomonas methanica]|uniref:DUF4365 domain-containing protein n=1 Tax=Methylomonas methanica TaxID=421 RepID=A0A177MGZ4_METMH|nr:hypothetical protein [Methylomonas methanica]OAI04210.1 hypothetical protein A1332_14660 [Methylomonas methanica]
MIEKHKVKCSFDQTLSTQQIGKLGELFIQYRLLQYGIESAHLTTDAGIDLVAYSSQGKKAFTVQIKTNLAPKPAGGKGKLTLDWWVPVNSPAEYFAFVDISESRAWIFHHDELKDRAQQTPSTGKYHLYMYVDSNVMQRQKTKPALMQGFDGFKLENRIRDLFFDVS